MQKKDFEVEKFKEGGVTFTFKSLSKSAFELSEKARREFKPIALDFWDSCSGVPLEVFKRLENERIYRMYPGIVKKRLLKRKILKKAKEIKHAHPEITNTRLAYHHEIHPLFEEMYGGMDKRSRLRILSEALPGKPGRPKKYA